MLIKLLITYKYFKDFILVIIIMISFHIIAMLHSITLHIFKIYTLIEILYKFNKGKELNVKTFIDKLIIYKI